MKLFRADLVEEKDIEEIYADIVRFAVDKFRERDFAQAVSGFRNAAKVRTLDAHHEALMKRAVVRWKQSNSTGALADAIA